MRNLLVHCNNKTLALVIQDDQDVIEEIRSSFELSGNSDVSLHQFSKQWDTWLTVIKPSDIPDMSEVRVTVATNISVITNVGAQQSGPLIQDISIDPNIFNKENNPPSTPTSETCTTPTSLCSDMSDVESPGRAVRLPHPFHLPIEQLGLAKSLTTKLACKGDLDQSDRRKILDGIYQYVTTTYDKLYFTKLEYTDIVDSLLRSFPHLPGSEGLSRLDSLNVWHGRLVHKVKNSRRRYGRNHPEVLRRIASAQKRKKDDVFALAGPKRIKLSYGVPNYLPPRIEGEDDETMAVHISFLKRQARLDKSIQEVDKVSSKMDKTFPQRRDMIVMRGVSVVELQESFPILFSKDQLISEYNRIAGKDLAEQWQNSFQYIQGLAMLDPVKSEQDIIKGARACLSNSSEEEESKDATWAVGLLSLPGQMREKISDVVTISHTPKPSGGCIHVTRLDQSILDITKFFVFMDGIQVAECSSLQDAWMVLMAASYVFNIVYPKEQKSTMNFCQRILLGIQDTDSKDMKVVKLLGRVKKLMKNVSNMN